MNFDIDTAWAALRAVLIEDAGVLALVPANRIVDHAPADIEFPYIRLDRTEVTPDDTDNTTGARIALGLECFTRPEFGRAEASKICSALYSAIHRQPVLVQMADESVLDIQVQTYAIDRDKDGATWRGVISYEMRLES
jgi:hypothetical protein